jgi:hypothetical protein
MVGTPGQKYQTWLSHKINVESSLPYISTNIIFLLPTYSVDQVPMSESLAQDSINQLLTI